MRLKVESRRFKVGDCPGKKEEEVEGVAVRFIAPFVVVELARLVVAGITLPKVSL